MNKRIVVLGSLNVDLVVTVQRFPVAGETVHGERFDTFLGGKGGNQAAAAARLGGEPLVLARVGNDGYGRMYRDSLTAAGADTSRIETVDLESTGTALIEVERSGQNRIVIVAGANGSWSSEAVEAVTESLGPGDTLLLQLEIPRQAVWRAVEIAAQRGADVILDPAPAPSSAADAIPDAIYPLLCWITPNESEAAALTGVDTGSESGCIEAAQQLRARGVKQVALKAGAAGVWLALSEPGTRDVTLVPGFTVPVVDTTAAGDAFNGGLAVAIARGDAPEDAVRFANAVAALSVTALGAQTGMPTLEAVQAQLETAAD